MSISGRCLCGAVSYTCSAPAIYEGNCHCKDCKKSSGSGYAPAMFFSEESVSISGKVKYYASKGSSGELVQRGFCGNCGSQLFGKPEIMPGSIAIRAGSLDNPSDYKPQMGIFTSHSVAWDVIDKDLPSFPEMPPQE